jgi:hypothetical protein
MPLGGKNGSFLSKIHFNSDETQLSNYFYVILDENCPGSAVLGDEEISI